jgi:ribonuclease P protein component
VDEKSSRDAAKRDAIASRPSTRLRFPRGCRLVRTVDYEAVYRAGRRRASQHFVVFFSPNGRGMARFGVSAKRALGTAVERNRIRRRIREILRLHRQEIASGWDIVIHPRSSVATAEFGSLATELLRLLRAALGGSREAAGPLV